MDIVIVNMPVIGQNPIVECQRDNTKWMCEVKSYPGGKRVIYCPTCGRGYFFMSKELAQAINAYDKSPSYGVETMPEVGYFYADRALKIVRGKINLAPTEVRLPY